MDEKRKREVLEAWRKHQAQDRNGPLKPYLFDAWVMREVSDELRLSEGHVNQGWNTCGCGAIMSPAAMVCWNCKAIH